MQNVVVNLFLLILLYSVPVSSSDTQIPSPCLKPMEGDKPKILAISIPKAGTYLLRKVFERYEFFSLNLTSKSMINVDGNELKKMHEMHYTVAHYIASEEHTQALTDSGYKLFFIYRDPRDQIVSAAYYMKQNDKLWACGDWPLEKIISHLIVDCSLWCAVLKESPWYDEQLKSVGTITDFYNLFLDWRNFPGIYITTFEKLVGARGGGDDDVQFQELQKIAAFCNREVPLDLLGRIQRVLFGNTYTFRSGQIGSWKSHFTEQDKATFKSVAGQLLIDLGYEKDCDW